MKVRVTLHRVISWWLAIFSVLTILTGYATSRKWFAEQEWITRAHIIIKWSFFSLMLYHVIYTFIYVNFKGVIVKSPKIHWVRLIQQITKWLILAFTILTMISGFSHYDWTKPLLPSWFMDRIHDVYDVGLTLSIIIHTMAGFKIMFKRKNINKKWTDILILLGGLSLIAGVIYLEVIF
ncbi:MAG: hypothetical protein ACTSSH_01160 [Candidatus Heimdallarchaeota archaeon]